MTVPAPATAYIRELASTPESAQVNIKAREINEAMRSALVSVESADHLQKSPMNDNNFKNKNIITNDVAVLIDENLPKNYTVFGVKLKEVDRNSLRHFSDSYNISETKMLRYIIGWALDQRIEPPQVGRTTSLSARVETSHVNEIDKKISGSGLNRSEYINFVLKRFFNMASIYEAELVDDRILISAPFELPEVGKRRSRRSSENIDGPPTAERNRQDVIPRGRIPRSLGEAFSKLIDARSGSPSYELSLAISEYVHRCANDMD